MYVNGLQLEAIVIVFQNVLFVDTIIDFVFILVGRSSFDSFYLTKNILCFTFVSTRMPWKN